MKKYKLLPILGASLLVLTACNSSGGEDITAKKAGSYYNYEAAMEYSCDMEHSKSSQKVSGVEDSIAQEMMGYFSASVFVYLECFGDNYYPNLQSEFLNEYKVEEYASLAKFFDEGMEYRLENKQITASFTGSAHDQKYGYAMYFSATYNSVGLLKSGAYSFAVSQDKDGDGKVDYKALFTGSLSFAWVK